LNKYITSSTYNQARFLKEVMKEAQPVFTPTPQQAQALQQIKLFLAAPGAGVFILKGYAGTGKTTLLQQLALA